MQDTSWLRESVWDEENLEHVARHGVTLREVDEVMFNPVTMTRPTAHPLRALLVGQTKTRRLLTVVLARVGENQGRCITARPASRMERTVFKEWKANK